MPCTQGPYIHRHALDIALRLRRNSVSAGADHATTAVTKALVDKLHHAMAAVAVEDETERDLQIQQAATEGMKEVPLERSQMAEEVSAKVYTAEKGRANAGAAEGSKWSEDEAEEAATSADTADAGGGDESIEDGQERDENYDACSKELLEWSPEVRLYGAGRGLGQGISLLGRPFRDDADVVAALEGAKSMAHMLRSVYSAAVEETAPDLMFEDRSDGPTGSCSPASPATEFPALGTVRRIWEHVELLDGPVASSPSTPPPALTASDGAQQRGAVAPGSKDKRRLRRGPSTGDGGTPTRAIAAG